MMIDLSIADPLLVEAPACPWERDGRRWAGREFGREADPDLIARLSIEQMPAVY
jgi:hypothetical protein